MPELHPTDTMLPPARRRRAWWALPLVLSLLFVLGVAAVLQWSDARDLDDQQRTLIADALSMESQLSARMAPSRPLCRRWPRVSDALQRPPRGWRSSPKGSKGCAARGSA